MPLGRGRSLERFSWLDEKVELDRIGSIEEKKFVAENERSRRTGNDSTLRIDHSLDQRCSTKRANAAGRDILRVLRLDSHFLLHTDLKGTTNGVAQSIALDGSTRDRSTTDNSIYRFFSSEESMTEPSTGCSVSADVSERFPTMTIRCTERDFVDGLIENEGLVRFIGHTKSIAGDVQEDFHRFRLVLEQKVFVSLRSTPVGHRRYVQERSNGLFTEMHSTSFFNFDMPEILEDRLVSDLERWMELYLDTKSTETKTDGSFILVHWREFLSADRLIFSLQTKTQRAFEQVHLHSILMTRRR